MHTIAKALAVCLTTATLFVGGPARADWPQWRGPARDGVAAPFAAKAWPEKLTKVWTAEVGPGHSSPVVGGGRAYIHSRQGEAEVVSAFDLGSGKLLWRDSYPSSYTPPAEAVKHGQGPFATPLLAGGALYAYGVNSVLSAYDAASGKLLWREDLGKGFPAPRPYYGTSASPLLAGGKLVVYAGGPGKGALLALDPRSGKRVWRWDGEGPPYASPLAAEFGGVPQVLTQTQQSIVGISLADGKLLWRMPFQIPYDQTIVTPAVQGDTFFVSGEDADLQAIRVGRKGEAWSTEKVWSDRSTSLYMSSPVLAGGVLYGYSSMRRGYLFAADPRTGKVLWKTQGGEGDHASLVTAGDALLVLRDSAELLVLRRTGEGFQKLAQYTVADSATWAHPVVLDGRLLVKDARNLTLWSLR
jgi:outer membrane protein assembly factor BamB